MKDKTRFSDNYMVEIAEERTTEEMVTAKADHEDVWVAELFDGRCDDPDNYSYAIKGFFDDAVKYFESRRNDILNDKCIRGKFMIVDDIIKMFNFDFSFGYEVCKWNGKSHDPDDDPFDVVEVDTDYLDEIVDVERVSAALRRYLITAGAKAKSIGSDSYATWRRLLMQYEFTFDEFHNAVGDVQAIKDFMSDIEAAARVTWADAIFLGEQKNLSRNTKEKGVKRAKK